MMYAVLSLGLALLDGIVRLAQVLRLSAPLLYGALVITVFRPWYLAQKQPDDLVVSASPEFLLAPACRRLGIRPPIASRVDARTGRYTGLNCKGAEKVSRFREQYPDAEIGQFYSDSRSDAPLAHLARRAFLVRGDSYTSWEV